MCPIDPPSEVWDSTHAARAILTQANDTNQKAGDNLTGGGTDRILLKDSLAVSSDNAEK